MSTDIQNIIIRPLFTEKMSRLEDDRKYSFQVSMKANKLEIKKSIESLFDVKVDSVTTMNRIGKEKTMTVRSGGKTIRTNGKRANWKKAIITLKDGENLDLMEMSVES